MNIYIGNLNDIIGDINLKEVFQEYGTVNSARVIINRYTEKSRGFGFIDMPNEKEALKAIDELDGADWAGNIIVVKNSKKELL